MPALARVEPALRKTILAAADSPRFAELWGRHEVEEFVPTTVELNHPGQDPVPFTLFTMDLDEASSVRLLVYLPPGATVPQPVWN